MEGRQNSLEGGTIHAEAERYETGTTCLRMTCHFVGLRLIGQRSKEAAEVQGPRSCPSGTSMRGREDVCLTFLGPQHLVPPDKIDW